MRKEMSNSARLAMFAPLEQVGRAEAVAARLFDAITLGLLDDAEQLPSEAELAAQFRVSTVTVREALAVLRQQGLVETRRGRGGGSFVRTPDWPAQSSWAERLRLVSMAELRDFGDHYLAVAGSAAKLAAERSTPEDLERLRLTAEDLLGASGPTRPARNGTSTSKSPPPLSPRGSPTRKFSCRANTASCSGRPRRQGNLPRVLR